MRGAKPDESRIMHRIKRDCAGTVESKRHAGAIGGGDEFQREGIRRRVWIAEEINYAAG